MNWTVDSGQGYSGQDRVSSIKLTLHSKRKMQNASIFHLAKITDEK